MDENIIKSLDIFWNKPFMGPRYYISDCSLKQVILRPNQYAMSDVGT